MGVMVACMPASPINPKREGCGWKGWICSSYRFVLRLRNAMSATLLLLRMCSRSDKSIEGGGNSSGNSGSDTDRSWAKLSSWNSLQQRAVAQANRGHDLHHPTRLLRGNDCQSNLSDSSVEISVDGAEVKECGQAMTLACLIHMSSFILLLNTRGALSNVSNGRVFSSEFFPGRTYLEPSWRRLVMFHGPCDECDLVGQRQNVQAFLERVNTTYIIIDKSRMQRLIGLCNRISADLNNEAQNFVPQGALDPFQQDRREDRFGGEESNFISNPPSSPSLKGPKQQSKSIWSLDLLKNILILPGTKWCGAGDIADHYNDLGYYGDVDKCCR
ncbi:hypothetical protein TCAL_14309 [Tigriopus californicus]|uniref:Phospholipase A2-like central domain-containing protein n=2 Tax=Tigriopus californicus TaxID=6832 RepID=A0A553NED6_TIGCA|nr:hypothetical protein TCAL_14309 [Tigriopus californicus]